MVVLAIHHLIFGMKYYYNVVWYKFFFYLKLKVKINKIYQVPVCIYLGIINFKKSFFFFLFSCPGAGNSGSAHRV